MTSPIPIRRDSVQDDAVYRCIHAACARTMPRRVNFCPYCGTGQHAGLVKPAHVMVSEEVPFVAPTPRPAPPVPEPAPVVVPVAQAPAAPAKAHGAAPPTSPQRPAAPPTPEPVRLRYWLLAVGLLWFIWIWAKPGAKRIESRIERVIVMSQECKFGEAQDELIALQRTAATPEQLQRLQAAINAAVPACDKKRTRAKAAVPKPKADVPKAAAQNAQSVRNLVKEAESAIALGDYKAARDKMEVCTAMVDAGNRECIALKTRAERLAGEMRRCLAEGGDWVGQRCE